MEECLLTTDLGNAIREAVKEWARTEGLEPYDQDTQTGYLRHLVVREGRNTGQALVVLVTAPGEHFDADFLVETLTRFPEVRSIHWAINDQPSEVTNLPTRLLWGDAWIEEELLGLRFRVRPNAFLQTNTEMAETLYELARDAAGLTGSEVVYDLYCGTGTIGLTLARDARLRLGRRDLGGVGRLRDRERGGERDRERALLRGQRGAVARGAAASTPGRPTSSSSIHREPGSPGRRCAAPALSGRRASSTSRATRRRSRPTSPCCATSTATSSFAARRSTCSRTRRTSRASRFSSERAILPMGTRRARPETERDG